MKHLPQFPIYIPSKGRHDCCLTARALDKMGVPYFIIVEEHQRSDYAQHNDPSNLLVLDPEYQRQYETLDDIPFGQKSTGPGPARNFAWDHSISLGYTHHWFMDDNCSAFYRYNKDTRVRCYAPGLIKSCEDFTLRYDNIAQAGIQYRFFCVPHQYRPPFVTNTRIYSFGLIRNDVPFRWRGRYNEDTILSLDCLKAGWATVQFNHALADKLVTQALKGGNTAEFYAGEGTKPKSEMLERTHPDVAKVVWKYGRWHHEVNYRPFKSNPLNRDHSVPKAASTNNFGMRLVKVDRAAHQSSLRQPKIKC